MTSRPARPASHPSPAELPPSGLPGLEERWSRLVTVPASDEAGTGGAGPASPGAAPTVTWHVLDNAVDLAERGVEPVGTLLCVHGNPTWSYLWRGLVAAAARGPRPWRVIAVDQLEMGFSERTGRFHRLADRVRELGDLTRTLGLAGPVVTVGHDWGGAVSLGWAVDHPADLAGIVLLNTAVHQPLDVRPPPVLRLAMAPAVRQASTVTTTGFLDTTLAIARPRLAADVRAAFRAPYRGSDRRAGIGDFVADIPVDAAHPSRGELERIAAGVARLGDADRPGGPVPALLAWGPHDPVFGERFLRDLRARLPRADVHRFERAGHLVAEDADVADLVGRWLDARRPGDVDVAGGPQAAVSGGAPYRPLGAALAERSHDDGAAVVELRGDGTRTVSWALLARRTEQIARGLSATGIGAGDRVALLVPPGADLTAVLYACLRIGAVPVVADAGLGVRGLSRAVRSAGPDLVIGIERALVAARALGWSSRLVAAGPLHRRARRALGVEATLVELADLGAVSTHLPPEPDPDADAAILFTSGSTGPAKGVVYTHRRLAAVRDAIAATYGIGPGGALVAAFAPFALLGPALGATSASPDMDVTAPATLTARTLAAAVRAVDAAVVFASPAALDGAVRTADALDAADRAGLAGVRTFLSAGAPVPVQLLESAQALMPSADARTPYGMTESLLVTDVSLDELRAVGPGDGVCVGRPVPGVRVRLSALDGDGAATGELSETPHVVGEIVIAAAHAKDHYDQLWGTQRDSARPAGWHRTGDVGHLDDDGRLWVAGRLAHVLVTERGVLTPVGLEQRAGTVPGVTRAAAVGVGPRGAQVVVLVVETGADRARPARGGGLADAELAADVRAALPDVGVAAVLAVCELPTDVRHNSKVDRTRVARWAADVLSGRRARL